MESISVPHPKKIHNKIASIRADAGLAQIQIPIQIFLKEIFLAPHEKGGKNIKRRNNKKTTKIE